jgi:hypothetical protein
VRTPLRPRTLRAAAAVPVLLVALAGCSGAETTSTSAEPSESTTAAEPSEEAGASDTEAGDPGGAWDEETLVPAMKAALAEQETAHVTMTTSAGGQSFTAEGDLAFRGAQQDMRLTMDGAALGAESVEVRLVDRVLYLAMPPMTPKGKFLEVRPEDKSSPMSGMLDQMGTLDPRETFGAFEKGLREVRFVGEESVDGEDLQHYRLTVDFQAAAKAQGMPRTQGMPKTLDYDMWLDDDALMRRIEMDVQQVRTEMEMADWGEPVSIEPPAAEDIVKTPQRR